MDVAPSFKGSLLLSENSDVDRPDSGIIIGADPASGLKHGDHVLVPPYAGTWFRDVVLDGLQLWEVRFYGISDVDEYISERDSLEDMIPAVIGESIQPRGEWVLLKRDENHDRTETGILLTDRDNFRTQKATVIAVGTGREVNGKIIPLEVKVGDRVMYHGPAQHIGLKGLVDLYPHLPGDSSDYSLIKESGIYCIIN